jgi:serine phosphatase RsbU (regulator of sigma subunit)
VAVFLVLFTLVRFSGGFGASNFDWQGYTFDRRDMALTAAALCCLAVLYLRFRDEQKEQRRQAQELAAGQRVQEFLLQSESTGTSLFEVEKAYLPALEVGGDFYQLMPRSDGSLMVVVGDVSGKGLEAAMMGARLLGALETLTDLAPGEVLSRLNQTLHRRSQGGFVTCCCALFAADGSVTIANAGHPAPYCDGREVEVEAGLPLGIMDGMPYGESVLAGGRFSFVSDGVVEAENAHRELFGFDRTREISGKSAQEIAEVAKAWGQTDDISVVTVRSKA